MSWIVEVMPLLEAGELHSSIDRAASWDAAVNTPAVQTPLKVLQCPDWVRELTPEPAFATPYLGIAGLGANAPFLPHCDRNAGVFGHDRRTTLDAVTDGMSNTLLILESACDNGPWARGGPSTVRALDPGMTSHLGTGKPFGGTHFAENGLFTRGKSVGSNAAMADGSVRFLDESIAPHVLEALATVAGGEAVSTDW